MALSICDLPEDILGEISKHLSTVDDVLALQSAHPKLATKINRTFWRIPKCLCLSADEEIVPHLIIEETKQMKFAKHSWARLQAVLSKAKNLKELVLGHCGKYFSEETLCQALIFIQRNNEIKIQKILAFYQNPEKFCRRNKDSWPSKRTHD
uniref:F-box domain-containing protein n=1 Tax=Panagrolaimus sp. ES5 TaxID=591445 RepID=A0AC34GKS9_9BILA